jgi:hypothetical protein
MSTINIATYPHTPSITYGQNLGRAALGFFGALLGSQIEVIEVARKVAVVKADRAETLNLRKLYRLAGGSDSVSPKAVAELNATAFSS